MIDLLLAALLLQTPPSVPDACNAFAPAAPLPAGCPGWTSVRRQTDGELFADPATVRRTGDIVEVRARFLFDADREAGYRSYQVMVWLDCARRIGAIRHISLFDAAGRRVNDFPVTGEQAEPRPLPANSPVTALHVRYCPGGNAS